MRGDTEVIDFLNEYLTAELTAINQYFVHHKMCENWGYHRLSSKKRQESIEEMKHADDVIDRILFLEGVPNMQRLFPVRVGEDAVEMNKVDLEMEVEAAARLRRGIEVTLSKGDHVTRELLEHILENEEESINWLEAQQSLVKDVGREHYLAQQMRE